MGCSTCRSACWISRSITVGMPSSRCVPSGFGIITRRTGLGRYVPCSSCSRTPGRALVGLHALPRLLQVLSRQRSVQQRASPCILARRPRVPSFTTRASGFVADGSTPGFTVRFLRPPGFSPASLTHGLRHHDALGSLTLVRPFVVDFCLLGPVFDYYDLC